MEYILDLPPEKPAEVTEKGNILHTIFQNYYDHSSMEETLNAMGIPEDFRKKYKNHLDNFIEFDRKHGRPIERELRIEVGPWKGIIDRVDEKDGQITVWDYKTRKGRDLYYVRDELRFYAFLYQAKTGKEVSRIGSLFTENGGDFSEAIDQETIKKQMIDFKNEIGSIMAMISRGEFQRRKSRVCDLFCSYRTLCKKEAGETGPET